MSKCEKCGKLIAVRRRTERQSTLGDKTNKALGHTENFQLEGLHMSENRTMAIMLFVLGLFLIATGIGLATVTETVTRYRNVYGFQVPYQITVRPYESAGVFLAITGIAVLGFAFYKNMRKHV